MSQTICPACKISLDEHSLSEEIVCLNFILTKIENPEVYGTSRKTPGQTRCIGVDTNG